MDTSGLFRVDGMIAVVTGGGTGIGFMMAKALAGAGARKVYILGRRKEVLERAAKTHPSIVPVVCDVGVKASLQPAVDLVTRDAGHVNLLVANAGIHGPGAAYNPAASVQELRKTLFDGAGTATVEAEQEFTEALHVNATGSFFTMLAFIELLDAGNEMAARDSGFGAPSPGKSREGGDVPSVQSQIIFTSSAAAYSRHWTSAPAYAASKAAVAHLAKQAATNLVPHGIRVNALAPGVFPTEMTRELTDTRDAADVPVDDPMYIPAKQYGGEVEMGGTILYLASRAGAYCNGLVLVLDGGKLSTIPSGY